MEESIKDLILKMVILRPLKNENLEDSINVMQETSEKLKNVQNMLFVKNGSLAIETENKTKKKTTNVEQLMKKMKKDMKVKSLNAIGNVFVRNNFIKKSLEGINDSADVTDFKNFDSKFEKLVEMQRSHSYIFVSNIVSSDYLLDDDLSRLNDATKSDDLSSKWMKTQLNDVTNNMPTIKKYKNKSISEIIDAGADFLQNFFEVSFVFRDKDQKSLRGFDTLMYTRTGSIEIPRLKAKTFTINTINGSVEKIASQLQGTYETTLNVRIDQDCFVLDKFAEIAGVYEFEEPKIYPASSIFMEKFIDINRQHRLDIVIKEISGFEHNRINTATNFGFNFFNFNFNLLNNSMNSEPNQFRELYHKYRAHSDLKSGKKYIDDVNTPNVLLNGGGQISEWILEDVRIIGISDIDYSFDTTSPPEVSIQLAMKSAFHRIYN
jgi:hypothetical protein